MTALDDLNRPDEYPLSSKYDAEWLVGLDMGPNPLWLLEDLTRDLDLKPGMRVLDLGSGMGATSVFLAREFGVEVVAADLWVEPDRARAVFEEAGVADRVEAVGAEAHALPFPPRSFDAVVSVSAFTYFGTDDTYLGYITHFMKPEAQLGMAVPGMTREVRDLGAIPAHIKQLIGTEAMAWHTAEWWRFHWEITELVTVTSAKLQAGGWQDWLAWARACRDHPKADVEAIDKTIAMLEADQGRYLSFVLLTARVN